MDEYTAIMILVEEKTEDLVVLTSKLGSYELGSGFTDFRIGDAIRETERELDVLHLRLFRLIPTLHTSVKGTD
jgi:hypothetical protein